jgi:hypothetical protein
MRNYELALHLPVSCIQIKLLPSTARFNVNCGRYLHFRFWKRSADFKITDFCRSTENSDHQYAFSRINQEITV